MHFLYQILFVLCIGIFFVIGLRENVQADTTSVSVTIVTSTMSTTPTTTPTTTTETTPTSAPFTATSPLDSTAPQFIFPEQEQVKMNSFFDAGNKVQFLPISSSEIMIYWYSNEAVRFSFVYGETDQYEIAHFSGTLYAKEHNVRLIALSPQKKYFGKITIFDQSGNSTNRLISFVLPVLPEEKVEETVKEEENNKEEEETPVLLEEKQPSITEDIKKIVTDLFASPADVSEDESPISSGDMTTSPGPQSRDETKNTSPYGEKLSFDEEVVRAVGNIIVPKSVRTTAAQLSIVIASTFDAPLSVARSLVQAIEIPGPQVFVMPSIINRGFSSLGYVISVGYQLLSEEFSFCMLVGVDGIFEIIIHEALRTSLCE